MTTAEEELKVSEVVLRRSEHTGFGFSLLGTTGPPHVIYDIVENSPAADCGVVEAGDIILKVNGTDVHRYTTKQVLKCLRLSDDVVTLVLKRDPKLKARIKEQLANTQSPHYAEIETSPHIYDYKSQHQQQHHPQQRQQQQTSRTTHNNSTSSDSCDGQAVVRVASPPFGGQQDQSYRSPTHLPQQQQQQQQQKQRQHNSNSSLNHSRNSSGSSAKIQLVESNNSNAAAVPTTSTSPTCRPSRIPTAMKSTQKPPVQHSPQHKRARPSQIPTKASSATAAAGVSASVSPANGSTPTLPTVTAAGGNNLQHSHSYSGNGLRHEPQQQQRKTCDSEPLSAPPQPTAKAPRFEAYMMTGDLILNLSRTTQSSNPLPGHAKKVDSLRDSPSRSGTAGFSARAANGGSSGGAVLAPRASGESSPTSSSSMEESPPPPPACYDSLHAQKHSKAKSLKKQQQQRDSYNNSYNNSNSAGGCADEGISAGAGERQYRKDSLTNDTLVMCAEIERDDDDDDDAAAGRHNNYCKLEEQDNKRRQQSQQRQAFKQQQQQQQQQQRFVSRRIYQPYANEGDGDECLDGHDYIASAGEAEEEGEDEEDHTHYGITNIETYNSGCGAVGDMDEPSSSDRQCLVMHSQYGEEADENASARQRLRALKKKAAAYKHSSDAIDCAQRQHYGGSGGSSTSSATVKSDGLIGGANTSQDETSFSVPTSPISLSMPLIDKETANSVPTSPEPSSLGMSGLGGGLTSSAGGSSVAGGDVVRRHNGIVRKCDAAGFRTSKSEDHLQLAQRDGIAAVIPIDIDEDVNSSLNTLLDTRQDSEDSQASNRDRIVWTYNAPLLPHQLAQLQQQQQREQHHQLYGQHHSSNSHSHSHSHSSSISSSPQHSGGGSPAASPTSVSSSVMSSSGSKGALGMSHHNGGQQQQQQQANFNGGGLMASATTAAPTMGLLQCPTNCGGGAGGTGGGGWAAVGDHSVSEAISNMSSPDYQDDDNLLSSRDLLGGMVLSDPSDSDSTILVSDAQRQQRQQSEHKLVIQVRGIDNGSNGNGNGARSPANSDGLKDSEDELVTLTEETPSTQMAGVGGGDMRRESSPPVSDDGSDVESLHSYHYSPKAVDMPSAIRLAKRLYSLDGFKKSDVSRHLSKNNDFSRAVADEYLKYFSFDQKTLDQALREFLQQFSLSGETQERERVLVHFSKRFLDCNPGAFNSQDAVHTLTCAIMLLNTDLHGQNIGRKMTCPEFIENLAELNDGENFPKDVLKYLYQAIKTKPLEWALDDDALELQKQRQEANAAAAGAGGHGFVPILGLPEASTAVEYKKGYVMRKCCYDANNKKTPFGKRSWKMLYCTLRDLVLYLHKDDNGFRQSQISDNLHNAIRIHHALATKAADYTKKEHVFRLQTADQAEYLFQTSDSKELQSWVETINFVCAAYSAPPLEGGVGSQKRFQRPLLPSAHTKLLMKEQLTAHEQQLAQLEVALGEHKKAAVPSKGLALQNYKEKDTFLQHELRRYKAYVSILSVKLLADQQQQLELQQQQQQLLAAANAVDSESADTFPSTLPGQQQTRLQQLQQQQPTQPNNSINAQQQQQQQQSQQQQHLQQTTANRYNYRAAVCRSEAAAAAAAQQQHAQQQQQQHHQQQQQQDIG